MELIPAIDLYQGGCVRLLHGDFDQVTHYPEQPATLRNAYRDAGAATLHVVDLDGAREGRPVNTAILATLAAGSGIEVQVGGGLRTGEDVAAILDTGVSRAVVGSTAINAPETVIAWSRQFGGQRLVIALDVRLDGDGVPRLASHGWQRQQETSLWEVLGIYADSAIRHVLCTDIGRDGAMNGPNLELYAECCRRFPDFLIQASGGVRRLDDLRALAETGVAGAISGRALLEGDLKLEESRTFLPNA